jgi:NAD(P)-dependent dehydrogenase (short-subunit alcohol dehydrogenase family)
MAQNIIITGGSSGIGKGIAKYFYEKGWQVLITGRNADKLQQVVAEMPGIAVLQYDNLKDGDHLKIADFVKTNWNGSLNILVNNAGHVELGELSTVSQASMAAMYQSHAISPSLLTSACLDFLTAEKGQILNVTSSHGIKAYPLTSAYSSAKAALNMLTRIWALELAPKGIRVNAIAPGPTDTDILRSSGFDDATIKEIHVQERESIPLKRRGQVDDVVCNAVLLLDSGSNWTTGVVLATDGGISIS